MRILLTGKNGQVGWELQRTLCTLGEIIACDRSEMDLSDPDSIVQKIRETRPEIIVNAAAYTAVDKAESEPDIAMAINGVAPGIIAEEARRIDAAVIHYSTDYVFDGSKNEPYTEEDKTNPINVYGKTKLAGEDAIKSANIPYYIFRTSWVYSTRGKNFVNTILRLAKEKDELRIVDDQFGAPTWSFVVANMTAQILAQGIQYKKTFLEENEGIYNLTTDGNVSWFEFANAIFKTLNNDQKYKKPKLIPIKSYEYLTSAERPSYSCLSTEKLTKVFGLKCPSWDMCLDLSLAQIS